MDNADQPGGQIFAEQLNANGPNKITSPSTSAILVNGLDNTKIQFRCLQGSGNSGTWVTVLGKAKNKNSSRVSIFTGATGSAIKQYHVNSSGNLTARGVYHEKSSDSLQGLFLDDSGTLAIDATRFSYRTSPTAPLVSVHDFDGLLTIASSLLLPVDSTHTCRISITGDGSRARVLSLNNQYWLNELGVTADTVWQNRATPPARGGLIGCNVNSNLKGATPNGFAFLDNIDDNPDMTKSPDGSRTLDNRGNLNDESILEHLAPLRNAQIWEPSPSSDESTNLSIYRVMISAQAGTAIKFCANKYQL